MAQSNFIPVLQSQCSVFQNYKGEFCQLFLCGRDIAHGRTLVAHHFPVYLNIIVNKVNIARKRFSYKNTYFAQRCLFYYTFIFTNFLPFVHVIFIPTDYPLKKNINEMLIIFLSLLNLCLNLYGNFQHASTIQQASAQWFIELSKWFSGQNTVCI